MLKLKPLKRRVEKPEKQNVIKGVPLVTSSAAVFNYSAVLKNKHSLVDRFGEPYNNYKVVGKNTKHPTILLPREKFPLGLKDDRIDGDDISINFIGKPRNKEQKNICKNINKIYKNGTISFIIHASTGLGKTFLACHAISRIRKTTLVLVTKADLETQWRDSFIKFLGVKSSDIGLIKADSYNIAGKSLVIGYVQSLMKPERYPSWVYKHFGMVICDEVHQLAADKFIKCMWMLPAKYRLGLSATVDRSDGKEHVFRDHIGEVLITSEMLPMPFDVVKVETLIKIPKSVYFKAGRMMKLCNYFGAHGSRQKLITKYIKAAFKKGRTVVCFADTLNHLELAFDRLVDKGVKPKYIGIYVGGLTEEERYANAHKPIVLTTYRMTSVGTDFPHWDCAVLMTPKTDVRQIVGRVLRKPKKGSKKKKPLVIDFVDDHKLLHRYWYRRMLWYNQKSDSVIKVNGNG